ncbi:hypothetical protein SAMN04488040_0721 [Sulfitobacter marinus]|uniref:Uncharacterized protein n=1 Tax=Sulfitobacter marinus TaxID=394264 RepID=A0A1I6QH87_9RHOB|nr:hypothetical protein [Sulfitobacter marinus]SFS51678.1 hypothetical protein SAMN04488040_0721 [Sulfitobacter marinus]
MENPKLTKQDEDISAPEFTHEETQDDTKHGNWPEVLGVVLTAVLVWLMFAFTG